MKKMISGNRFLQLGLLLLVVAFIFSGCDMVNQGGESSLEEEITDDGRLPLEDSELAEHQPRHVLLQGEIDEKVEDYLEEQEAEIVDDLTDVNMDVYKVKVPEGTALTEVSRELSALAAVETAEPNYEMERMSSSFPVSETAASGLPETEDDYAEHLWGLAAINAPEAWEEATGEDVVIAVIDTGVYAEHPDLMNKMRDGFNVYDNNSDTWDYQSHGTHVAGTAAAAADGGVVGVAKDADIMPIKVFHEEGYPPYTFETARGIAWLAEWASNNEEEVVANMSLGGSYYSNIASNAIDAALEEDIVFTVSMGNSAMRDSQYPARYDGVIAVGAIDGQYSQADFTTTGDWMSVTAPGVDILSSEPAFNEHYGVKGGTSMSAPHVAGVAALLLDQNPDLSPGEVKTIIEETATVDPLWGEDDFSHEYGHGLVDAEAALAYDEEVEELQRLTIEVNQFDLFDFEFVPSYKSRVALYDDEGNYLKDTKTDDEGVAVFHNLTEGEYELKIHQSFADEMQNVEVVTDEGDRFLLGHGYSYLYENESVTIADADKEKIVELETSALADIFVEVEGVQLTHWLDEVDIYDDEDKVFNNLIYPDYKLDYEALNEALQEAAETGDEEKSQELTNLYIDYLEDHPGPILFSPAQYELEAELSPLIVGDVELNDALSIKEDITLQPGPAEEAILSDLELPEDAGIMAGDVSFIDEDGEIIEEEDFKLEVKFSRDGEIEDTVVYEQKYDEYTESVGDLAVLAETGEYDVTIQGGILYDAEDPTEYRKVGYTEEEIEVESEEVEIVDIEITLK